jgi:hypothetical protein
VRIVAVSCLAAPRTRSWRAMFATASSISRPAYMIPGPSARHSVTNGKVFRGDMIDRTIGKANAVRDPCP